MSRLVKAEELLERKVDRGNLGAIASGYHLLGSTCLLLGRIEDAQRHASRALEASKGQPTFAPRVLLLLADIASCFEHSDPTQVEKRYREAMAAAEAQGRRPTGARWEVYGPHHDDPSEVWTEVYWLLF